MPEEKIYVVPLGEAKYSRRKRRARSAVKILREFLVRHTKSEEITIDNSLNSKVWGRGTKSPPSKIRVKVVKQDDDSVVASLAE